MEHSDPKAQAGGDAMTRRDFIAWMSALTALLAAPGCMRQPLEKILPYARMPEEIVPGEPLFYATAMPRRGGAIGVLVESHLGRPTKIEGNPLHPDSLGASDTFLQGALLDLYDPDRSRAVWRGKNIGTWEAYLENVRKAIGAARERGRSFRVLTPERTSPTLIAMLEALVARYPNVLLHVDDALAPDASREGARLAFGEALEPRYDLARADVILSLDADFLWEMPGHLAHTRAFTARRKAPAAGQPMNRLYAIESTRTLTGAMADHRLAVRPSPLSDLAGAIAGELGVGGPAGNDRVDAAHRRWLKAVAGDLSAARGRSLVLAGENLPPEIHALVQAVNEALGNFGKTVFHQDPVGETESPRSAAASLRDLASAMRSGTVDGILILGANPVYDAPADLDFARALEKVPFRAHLGHYRDETAVLCEWHAPEAHFLESWGDARALDGTVSIQQPLIAPLFGGRSALEVAGALIDPPGKSGYDLVRDVWRKSHRGGDFEKAWRRWLHDGIIGRARPGSRAARARSGLSPRCRRLGRRFQQQRVAAGASPPLFESDLGQCRVDQPGDGPDLESHERRPRRVDGGKPEGDRAGLDRSRATRRYGDGDLRLRPHGRPAARRWPRVRRVPVAHQRFPRVRIGAHRTPDRYPRGIGVGA